MWLLSIFLIMQLTLLPVTLAGIMNALLIKKIGKNRFNFPLDNGLVLPDNRRLFGNHKTLFGLLGYVTLGAIMSVAWGLLSQTLPILEQYNYFYLVHDNTVFFNLVIGISLGLIYALLELPNSFLKRRFGISDGKQTTGIKRWFFMALDHSDTVWGTVGLVAYFYPMIWWFYLSYVILGALTHWLIVRGLYLIKWRENKL